MSSLLPAESIAPDPTIVVAVCLACHHWQADCTPRARKELGGNQPALWALVELAAEHEAECVGAGGRVKVLLIVAKLVSHVVWEWFDCPGEGVGRDEAVEWALGHRSDPRARRFLARGRR